MVEAFADHLKPDQRTMLETLQRNLPCLNRSGILRVATIAESEAWLQGIKNIPASPNQVAIVQEMFMMSENIPDQTTRENVRSGLQFWLENRTSSKKD